MQRIERLLRKTVDMGGSDLHFKTDRGKAYVRVHGDLVELEDEAPYTDEEFRESLFEILKPEQVVRFLETQELDFATEIIRISRFRGNAYQQRGHVQAAFRVIPYEIQTMEELGLPAACFDFVGRPRGLVLVTGPAGSGKSTSLAAMVDRINRAEPVHIVTIEDPVEFVHDDHVALVNQRELDVDTNSFANALKYVLRQDPDVILVGEMRDLETIHLAITAAETGHLVFGTLHTVDAVQTVDRIVDVFPMHQQQQIRMQLSVNLIGVVSQTLVRKLDGKGRVAAFEVLVATPAVRNLIRENKTYQIASLIQTGAKAKMQSLDQYLAKLALEGLITLDDARSRAKDAAEFGRLMQLSPAVSTGSTAPPPRQVPVAPNPQVAPQNPVPAPVQQPRQTEQPRPAEQPVAPPQKPDAERYRPGWRK